MIRSIFIYLVLLCFNLQVNAQNFDWVNHGRIKYTSNPAFPEHLVKLDNQDRAIFAHIDSSVTIYGQNLYGYYLIECRDVATNLIWTFTLDKKAAITRITCDKLGNVYVGGSFMETMHINGTDSIANTGSGFNTNAFLLKIDNNGQLLWKKNLSLTTNIDQVSALACNSLNEVCFGFSDFFVGKIQFMDQQGNYLNQYSISGCKIVGDIDFDPFDNLYVVGAAENGNFTIGNLNYTVTSDYAVFVARYNHNGQASWAHFAHDITFQAPDVAVDAEGNAFVGGTVLMDSTDFGTVSLHAPQWSTDFFVVKVDSSGNFLWGQQSPLAPSITGRLARGNNHFLSSDRNGGVYAGLDLFGSLTFQNGHTVIAGSGIPTNRSNCLMHFDANGLPDWSKLGGAPNNGNLHGLDLDSQGRLYFTAHLNGTAVYDSIQFSTNGSQHFVIGRISPNPLLVETMNKQSDLIQVFPNPVVNELQLKQANTFNRYAIIDLKGAVIQQGSIAPNQRISVSRLKAGTYFIRLENLIENRKIKFIKQNN